MLIYSYQVEVKKLESIIKSLELDILINPLNTRAINALESAKQELAWYNKQIQEGKDPGRRVD